MRHSIKFKSRNRARIRELGPSWKSWRHSHCSCRGEKHKTEYRERERSREREGYREHKSRGDDGRTCLQVRGWGQTYRALPWDQKRCSGRRSKTDPETWHRMREETDDAQPPLWSPSPPTPSRERTQTHGKQHARIHRSSNNTVFFPLRHTNCTTLIKLVNSLIWQICLLSSHTTANRGH